MKNPAEEDCEALAELREGASVSSRPGSGLAPSHRAPRLHRIPRRGGKMRGSAERRAQLVRARPWSAAHCHHAASHRRAKTPARPGLIRRINVRLVRARAWRWGSFAIAIPPSSGRKPGSIITRAGLVGSRTRVARHPTQTTAPCRSKAELWRHCVGVEGRVLARAWVRMTELPVPSSRPESEARWRDVFGRLVLTHHRVSARPRSSMPHFRLEPSAH